MSAEQQAPIIRQPISEQTSAAANRLWRRPMFLFGVVAAILCAVFTEPLYHWTRFALSRERNSYLLMIPLVSAYLIWIKRSEIKPLFKISILAGAIPAIIASGSLHLAS